MNKNLFTFILMIVAAGTIYGQNGTLIAFVNGEAEIDKAFVTDTWPSIQKMALEYKLDPKLQNVEEGVPGAIRITPQLVFQNEYGRSFYVSRYTELDRLKIFLRSVRSTAKIAASNNKSNILIRPLGKSRTTLPLKLTKLTGEVPVGLDHEEFVDKAIKSFKSGFKKFQDGSIDFEPADRAYYVDLHPYISNDGKVYISFEVYSQFNCVVPVISYINDPMVGPFEEYDRVFSALGRRVETLIINYSNSVKNGDGFTPITDQPAVSWTELGLNIQSKQSSTASYKIAALEVDWENPQALDELTPLIQFNFQPPLDSYAGEAMALEGFMSWKSGF